MSIEWFARQIEEIWMKEPVHPKGIGYVKIDPGMLEILEGDPTLEEIKEELEKKAISRGYDYEFRSLEDYSIDDDITYHIIEWRQKTLAVVSEGE